MKPVGIERDLVIGSMKGYVISKRFYKEENRCRIYCGKLILQLDVSGGYKKHKWFQLPRYSTDRNDAWELWDELPTGKAIKERVDGTYRLYFYDPDAYEVLIAAGKDFADCVSQAWLNWKETK